jgi:hypothetical protein
MVGGCATPLKNISSSVGIMKFPTEGENNKPWFQTTNQISCVFSAIHGASLTFSRSPATMPLSRSMLAAMTSDVGSYNGHHGESGFSMRKCGEDAIKTSKNVEKMI